MLKLRVPYVNDFKVPVKVKYRVNLPLQMAECELNYAYLKKLLPSTAEKSRSFLLSVGLQQWFYHIKTIESSRYTTTLQLTQTIEKLRKKSSDWLKLPCLTVRMYHDAELAEVLAWEGHKRLRPRYDYPNQAMYQCDEKLQINQFLGEWLSSCLRHGIDSSTEIYLQSK